MARYARRLSAPRREWLVPALWNSSSEGDNPQGRPPGQTEDADDWNLPLGSTSIGSNGTKINANGLVRPAQSRDPSGPPGVAVAVNPLGPYTIERIVGTFNVATSATNLDASTFLIVCGVFDAGNPYEAAGTDPSIDRLRTQEGVMHCASGMITADSSGPATKSVQVDVRTKRVVVAGKAFYIINNVYGTYNGNLYFRPVIKVLVRYA